MPYFGGENSTRYAYGKNGEAITPQEFLEYVAKISLKHTELERLEASPLTEKIEWLDQSPPCLQHLVVQGFPKGTRNSGSVSYTHLPSPRDRQKARMPSSA